MNTRWKIVNWLTIKVTNFSNFLLRSRNWKYTAEDFKLMPKHSLGKNLYDYLKKNNISYKPNLIRHDIKHILLGYEMKMPDELKIHAFLIGNRSYNAFGILYLIICTLFVPEIIPDLKKEFIRGRSAQCLKKIDLQKLVHHDINNVRKILIIN